MNASEQLLQLLHSFAQAYNSVPELKAELKGRQGWINAVVGIRTDDNKIAHGLLIVDGHVDVEEARVPEGAATTLVLRLRATLPSTRQQAVMTCAE